MDFSPTAIPDVVIIQPKVSGDARGFFMETWVAPRFDQEGIRASFVQDNHSRSTRGVLRGLHYQSERAQGKLVRAIRGEVFDVAVDLRRSSPTFGHWVGMRLSEDNNLMMWIPPGFAHGFYVTSDTADLVYKCTDVYSPAHEHALLWNDPDVGIEWPLLDGESPTLSAKDRNGKRLRDAWLFP